MHPLSGVDHVLAAFAVGVWAMLGGARRPLLLSAVYMTAMLGATVLAATSTPLPPIEPAVAATVISLGLLIAFSIRADAVLGGMLVALFAIVHGHAHGAEGGAGPSYLAGLLLTTAALLLAGIGAGRLATVTDQSAFARLAGAITAAVGGWILIV